jgi:subtilisin-like proprotein convertase family protein
MLLATALVLELARQSLTGTHCRYRQYVDGLPTDEYVTRPCGAADVLPGIGQDRGEILGGLKPTAPLMELNAPLRIVDSRVARRVIVEDSPYQPYAYDYDALTGELLRREPLFFRGKPARVFDPNPVATLNDASLQDGHDSAAAVPASAYLDVELENTVPFGPLSGPFVSMADRQPPNVVPPDGSASLLFDRENDGFEDVNAYFHIDRSQQYLQSLGYHGDRAVAAYSIPVDAHAAGGADNSFFIPSGAQAGRGALFFGEGGTDDAEDADLLVHEYTHAIHEWIAPGTFGGAFASESRALAEGMADYWAYSTHAAARRASGRDPFCFADWDARCSLDDSSQRCAYAAGADCLRRLDSTITMAGYVFDDAQGVEHRNGAIWSSALRQIHDHIGKRVIDTILIESLFEAPPRPTFAVMALRLLEADRLLYQGTYAGAICSAMFTRGILSRCDLTPRGELTLFQSSERALPIPENNSAGVASAILVRDSRLIEDIQVRVDIDHPSRGDLRVELTAPDGTVIMLHDLSTVRAPDIHETYGRTAVPLQSLDVLRGRSAAGQWKLTVFDRRPQDAGVLRSWGLVIQFAGDEPSQSRPHGPPAQMIPVVGHLYGADERLFRSDVRIVNTNFGMREAILVFTRSGEDGLAHFAAVRVSLDSEQTVLLDDVLNTIFHTAGSGTLEVLGDVIVSSRTSVSDGVMNPGEGHSGTFGQLVPPALDTTASGEPPLLVAPIPAPSTRCNLGLTETAGARGVVRFGENEMILEPFSHVQFPVVPELMEIRVIEGDARVSGYLSQVEAEGDAMFIPAEVAEESRTRIAPVITTQGASNSTWWRSDLWTASRLPGSMTVTAIPGGTVEAAVPAAYEDVLASLFHRTVTLAALRTTLPPHVFGATRIVSGGKTQFVPLLDPDGGPVQDLLFVESSKDFRTNVGIVTEGPAWAEVRVRDAGGRIVETLVLQTAGGVAQAPVTVVVNGRAEVKFHEGKGRAYASLIDRHNGDATFAWGQ